MEEMGCVPYAGGIVTLAEIVGCEVVEGRGDLPLEAKVTSTRGYKVDKHGDVDGKGHAKRDIAEWMLPPLWPWKVIMLPARGPRSTCARCRTSPA